MRLHPALPLLALAAGTLACSEAAAPERVPNYEWRAFSPYFELGTDTLSFHWPREMLPVRIWVEDSLDMPAQFQEAIAAWKTVFLYGEYDAVLVTDSSNADVVVRVQDLPPPKSPTALGHLNALLPGCLGATDFDIDATVSPARLWLPVRIYMEPKYDPTLADLTECFQLVARHELGHSLGLFRHTGDPLDIMYGDPVATTFSVRDINTAQIAAHWPANLIPTR